MLGKTAAVVESTQTMPVGDVDDCETGAHAVVAESSGGDGKGCGAGGSAQINGSGNKHGSGGAKVSIKGGGTECGTYMKGKACCQARVNWVVS